MADEVQHNPLAMVQRVTIKGRADFLATKGWHRQKDEGRIGHGSGAVSVRQPEWLRNPIPYASSDAYAADGSIGSQSWWMI